MSNCLMMGINLEPRLCGMTFCVRTWITLGASALVTASSALKSKSWVKTIYRFFLAQSKISISGASRGPISCQCFTSHPSLERSGTHFGERFMSINIFISFRSMATQFLQLSMLHTEELALYLPAQGKGMLPESVQLNSQKPKAQPQFPQLPSYCEYMAYRPSAPGQMLCAQVYSSLKFNTNNQ